MSFIGRLSFSWRIFYQRFNCNCWSHQTWSIMCCCPPPPFLPRKPGDSSSNGGNCRCKPLRMAAVIVGVVAVGLGVYLAYKKLK